VRPLALLNHAQTNRTALHESEQIFAASWRRLSGILSIGKMHFHRLDFTGDISISPDMIAELFEAAQKRVWLKQLSMN
jgi:hypothetical protein